MEIRTKRLRLKPVDMEYLQSTHVYASDLENTRLMMFLPSASLQEIENTIRESELEWAKAQPERCEFVILREEEHIGGITLYFLEDRSEGELGWVLRKDCWGRGYTTEAAAAMLDYARDRWGMRRVIAMCDSENAASYRVMEKLGMRFVCRTGGRKNRSMEGERQELTYEIFL